MIDLYLYVYEVAPDEDPKEESPGATKDVDFTVDFTVV